MRLLRKRHIEALDDENKAGPKWRRIWWAAASVALSIDCRHHGLLLMPSAENAELNCLLGILMTSMQRLSISTSLVALFRYLSTSGRPGADRASAWHQPTRLQLVSWSRMRDCS